MAKRIPAVIRKMTGPMTSICPTPNIQAYGAIFSIAASCSGVAGPRNELVVAASSQASCPVFVYRNPPTSTAMPTQISASMPKTRGCATTDRKVACGEMMMPKNRPSRLRGGASAVTATGVLVI